VVSVPGGLGAPDLRRLERACARALEVEVVPLEIDLRAPPVDGVTRPFLKRLEGRGAFMRNFERASANSTSVRPARREGP